MGTETPGGLAWGPEEVAESLHRAESVLAAAPHAAARSGDRAAWAEVARLTQRVGNRAAALPDEAITHLAAIEPETLDDGTVIDSHRAPGHIALDAPDILAGAVTLGHLHAERRVRTAVRLAGDGPAGSTTSTGLGGLHEEMRAGHLDAYRAGVVADELELAPANVAEAVVATLGDHLAGETAPQLRRRCRRVLASICPDLLRERATRARAECGLRRWAAEPGVDRWEATFPSEDAARAWAAVDALAQRLVAEGRCDRVDRARAQALIDLVTGAATIETVLTFTVPNPSSADVSEIEPDAEPVEPDDTPAAAAGACPETRASRAGDDLVEVCLGLSGRPILVPRAWIEHLAGDDATAVEMAMCHPCSGALVDGSATSAYRPPEAMARFVRRRDGHCRFPGCSIAARFCDLDHVRPWPAGRTTPANLVCLCRRHHRIEQRPGWSVRLHPDGTTTWTDPTGRVRTTWPVDALRSVVLPAPVCADPTPAVQLPSDLGRPSLVDGDAATHGPVDEHSALESMLEHVLPGPVARRHRQMAHRRSAVDVRLAASARFRLASGTHRRPRRDPRAAPCSTDDPPF